VFLELRIVGGAWVWQTFGMSRSGKKKQPPAPAKRARGPAVLAFVIGVAALAGFIALDRMMAPPFPKAPTNSVTAGTNVIEMSTNAPMNLTNKTRVIGLTPAAAAGEVTAASGEGKEPSEIVADLITEGNEALEAGKAKAAIEKYQKAVETQPEDEDAHFNLGIALARAGKTEEAKKAYERALEIFPDYSEVHNNLGNLLMKEGKFPEAIEHFKKSLATMPDNSSAHNNYGTALARQGNVNEAVTHFAEAVRLKPDFLQARVNLANAYAGLRRTQEAAEQLAVVLKIDPNFQPAQRALANMRKRGGL
jgi:Tfp pilus assembly protein PilF